MNILVIGGAGYVGSHTAKYLESAGHLVVIFDNLSQGHKSAARSLPLVVGDLQDQALLEQTMKDHQIEAVMHFAAFALVGESVTDPAKYYQNNIVGTLKLLDAMRTAKVQKIVFSSTCATYGIPEKMPLSEATPQKPINPYGFTKLCIEQALKDYSQAYDLRFAALRYFNASGASPEGHIGEDHTPESHLIPIVLQVALGQREHIGIFGDDYPTSDGTCIRDYVHVDDLATAHLAALLKLESEAQIHLNLGTGVGASVKQVIQACREVTGHEIPEKLLPRRAGDPPELVADASQAKKLLSWQPQYTDIKKIVETAWNWHQHHPQGYGD